MASLCFGYVVKDKNEMATEDLERESVRRRCICLAVQSDAWKSLCSITITHVEAQQVTITLRHSSR